MMFKRLMTILFSPIIFIFEGAIEITYYIFKGKHDDAENIMTRWLLKNK